MSATENGHAEVVKLVMAEGADIHARNQVWGPNSRCGLDTDVAAPQQDGSTALMLAAQNGYAEVVRALVAAGADIDLCDEVREFV